MVFLSPMVCLSQMLFLIILFFLVTHLMGTILVHQILPINGQGNKSFGNNNGYKGKGNGGYKPRFNGNRNGQFWAGNTFHRQEIIHEYHICSKKGHNVVTCLFRSGGGQVVQECQICGKRGHIAIDCRYMGNYAYQRALHPYSLTVHYAFQDLSSQF